MSQVQFFFKIVADRAGRRAKFSRQRAHRGSFMAAFQIFRFLWCTFLYGIAWLNPAPPPQGSL